MDIYDILEKNNIAEDLDDDILAKIGDYVYRGYEEDKRSREDWEEDVTKWTELALQVSKKRTYPWPDASNVKYPLLSVAAMQFAARAYPSLVPSDGRLVKCKAVGLDPDGQKQERATRISKHMSYQLLEEMEEWEEDMDRLLVILPIIGICYKKTFFDPGKQRNVSKLILPTDLIVNYWSTSLDSAERKTEVLWKNKREVVELQRNGYYLDVDLGDPVAGKTKQESNVSGTGPPSDSNDPSIPYQILEQHGYYDLDEDGYPEPYIFTCDYDTKKVLRIAPRFTSEGIIINDKNKIARIQPLEFYTKFGAIPNPDGSGYDIGFGRLLGSINASVDTIINQLIDAGSLSNLQSGFVGKNLRLKTGDYRFTPGEWKTVNATVDDLKKGIFPLPVREPSNVLFQLLGLMIQSGKELASVAEIFVGKMPGQNTPAYTTKETVEQGMKLFTAIYKRIFRSMKKEFRKIYNLNSIYLDPEQYTSVMETPPDLNDYKNGSSDDVIPAADPMATSKHEKETQTQQLLQLLPLGTINPMAVTQMALEAMEIPNPEKLINNQPPPNPEAQKMQMEAKMEQEKHQMEMQKRQLDMQVKIQDAQLKEQLGRMELQMQAMAKILELQASQQQHKMEMEQLNDKRKMTIVDGVVKRDQNEQEFRQKMEQKKVIDRTKDKKTPIK